MKRFSALLLSILLLISFAACAKNPADVSSQLIVSVAQSEGISLKAEQTAFPENTVVKVEKLTSGKSFNIAKDALKESAEKFVAYDITATSENISVQPNGTVTATFDIPSGYDLNNIAVIYISDSSKTETLNSVVDKQSKTVTAELSHFSIYAVIEKAAKKADDDSSVPTWSESSSKPAEQDNSSSSGVPAEPSKPSHTHSFANATCTDAKKCACGVTEGKALGHDYIEDKCSRCGEVDKTYKALTSGHWTIAVVDGNTLYDFSFVFSGEEPNVSVGIGDNIKGLPEDFQNEILNNPADYSDSIFKVGNETYYVGRGFGAPITFELNKNTVIITEVDSTNTITLTRTAGDKYKITATNGDFMGTNNALKVGDVLVWQEAEIAEN